MSKCQELRLCLVCGEVPEVDDIDYVRCVNEDCLLYLLTFLLDEWQAPRLVEDGLRSELESESAWARDYLAQYQAEHARNLNLKAALRELRESQYRKHYAHFNLTCNGCQALYGEDCAPDCPWAAAGKLLEEE